MRVLHLVRALDVGGLEKVVLDISKGSSENGVESYLGCLIEKGRWASDPVFKDVWEGDLPQNGKLRTILSLKSYLKENKIDIIHTHNPQPHQIGVLSSILARVPLVHTKHGRNYPDNPKRVWLNKQLARFSKKIIAVSDNVASVAVDIEKVPAKKIIVIRNGVSVEAGSDKAEIEKWRDRYGIPLDAFVIGSVGRFSPEKNYPMLIRAFSKYLDVRSMGDALIADAGGSSKPPICLCLVGDGTEWSVYNDLITKLGLEDCCIMPGMKQEVRRWLKCMDVFCLSSVSEGTSLTLLEAGACGLPAVVTDVGGNSEVVQHNQTGIVVGPENEEAMASAFERLEDNDEMRTQMGSAAFERISNNYNLTEMLKQYMTVYENMLK